jgi:hypothetical protein
MRPDDRANVVPRRMLDLAKDLLRLCLAERSALQGKLDEAEQEIARLKRRLKRRA